MSLGGRALRHGRSFVPGPRVPELGTVGFVPTLAITCLVPRISSILREFENLSNFGSHASSESQVDDRKFQFGWVNLPSTRSRDKDGYLGGWGGLWPKRGLNHRFPHRRWSRRERLHSTSPGQVRRLGQGSPEADTSRVAARSHPLHPGGTEAHQKEARRQAYRQNTPLVIPS